MKTALARAFASALAAVLAACSGGGTDGTGATPELTSSGPITRGSVILNGTRFDETGAVVTDDRNRRASDLADGMVVKLRGRSDDGVTGRADRIDIENEVRGAIASIAPNADPQRFVVAGLTVLVDGETVFANVASFAALTVGMRVEVHGLRDAAGLLRATRVEANAPAPDELRGPIGDLDLAAKRFTINGNVTVDYRNAIFSPAGTNEGHLTPGAVVEVRGSFGAGVFTALQLDIEAVEDALFAGRPNEKQQVEGFVSGFTNASATFQVGGRPVRLAASTRFEGGSAADLANDLRVEVEGTIDAVGVLVATKLAFKHVRQILHGLATGVSLAPPRVQVLGQTVLVTDLTRVETRGAGGGNSTLLADLVPNVDCVQVRGFAAGALFIADEIKEPSGCGDDLVQAPVTAKNTTRFELTFFGNLVARLDGAGVQFRDANGSSISRAAFFAAVTVPQPGAPGTLVKVKGRFDGNALVGEEAELED